MSEKPKFSPKEIQELSKGLTRQEPKLKPTPKTKERSVLGRNVTYSEEDFKEATSNNNIDDFDNQSTPEQPADLSKQIRQFAEKSNINLKNISVTEVITQIRNNQLRQQLLKLVDPDNKDFLPNLPIILNSSEFSDIQKKAIYHSIKLALKNINDKNKKLAQKY